MVNGNALAHSLLALGGDDVGKGLGRMADDMDVHVVKADLHRAAQTGGAEFQRSKETALDLLLITRDIVQFLPFLFGEGRAVQPALVLFFIIPHRSLLLLSAFVLYSAYSSERKCQPPFRLCP